MTHPPSFVRPLKIATALAASGVLLLGIAPPVQALPGNAARLAQPETQVREQAQAAAQAAADRVRQKGTPPGQATPAKLAIDAGLRQMVLDGAIGVTGRVDSPTTTWSGSAGLRSQDGRPPAGRQDRFRVASITKTMVATLVLQEVDRGVWALDQRVEEVIPGIFPGHEYVTFRQLLSHTSGTPNGTFELLFSQITDWDSYDQFLDVIGRDYTAQDHLDLINAVPWTEPGEFLYSNAGYVALGLLLETQNGRPLSDLLRDRVWRPAGMNHTSLPSEPGLRGPVLEEDAWIGDRWLELEGFDPDVFLASGAAVSTTADLTAFTRALFTGRLVSPALVEEMLVPESSSIMEYGLGIYRLPDPCDATGESYLYAHDGASWGTLSFMASSEDGTRRIALGVTGRDLSAEPGRFSVGDALLPMLLATCSA